MPLGIRDVAEGQQARRNATGDEIGGDQGGEAVTEGQQGLRHPRKDGAASALKPGKAKALAGPANVF